MKILIEEYEYKLSSLTPIFGGIERLREMELYPDKKGMVNISYVGYYYLGSIGDCVLFLPKVILNQDNLVFGRYTPEEILNIDSFRQKSGNNIEADFLFNFSVWIYRAIWMFHTLHPDETICKSKEWSLLDGSNTENPSTIIDVLLSFAKYNKENKNFLLFSIRNIHAGFNKINWSKTISQKVPVISDGRPIYLNPVNKKKQINYEEELFVIYFSILDYINKKYGFKLEVNINFDLIPENEFTNYLCGYGKIRLQQIKYKYFSDKTLKLWYLCYTFFCMSDTIHTSSHVDDYLIAKKFNIVFEAIIDELIGEKDIPLAIKKQGDGKIVDHIYQYESLVNDNDIYYIGDSKYYKIGHNVDDSSNSSYKQYTYAKNVIQYNLDLFNDDSSNDYQKGLKGMLTYIDKRTDGYNITPNFFISAEVDSLYRYEVTNLSHRPDRDTSKRHFKNRLFDRDTLWLSHYDINFLYVLALYARGNEASKDTFRSEVRRKFRQEVIQVLENNYDFSILVINKGKDINEAIDTNFRKIIGKVYSAITLKYAVVLILALEKGDKYSKENNDLCKLLNKDFTLYENYHLGKNIDSFLDDCKKNKK